MAVPDPSEVAPWYLRNITQALELNEATGQVFVRTNAEIIGNVSVGNVAIGALGNIDISGNEMPVTVESGNVTVFQGTDPWTVTGNVNATVVGNVPGITANVTVVDGGGSLTVDGNVGITGTVNANITGGNITTSFAATLTDAFGRLRVSNPYTLFDSALSGERIYDFDTVTANGGTYTPNYDANVRELEVTAANGSKVERQTLRIFPYQPGKSLYSIHSFVPATNHANVVQRIGNFSTENGVFFEINGTTARFGIRSSSSGSVVTQYVDQSSWNVDTLDGSGDANNPSGIDLIYDGTAAMLFWNDIEWLGVGQVRFGFIIGGQFITAHVWDHVNTTDYDTTYMGTANLPVRVLIENTGATDGARTFQQICHTVMSEGGYNPLVETGFAGTGIDVVRLSTAGTYYPIASVRINPAYLLETVAKVSQIDVLSPTVNYYRWVLLFNPTLTGASWSNSAATDKVQIDTSATSYTGGTEIQSGFASSRESAVLLAPDIRAQLGGYLDGTPTIFTLAITATSNNADVLAQMGFQVVA